MAPRFDEATLARDGKTPQSIAEALAEAKAASISATEPAATVIGCDQLVAIDGRILGKPGSSERAIEQLQRLSGCTHELITALVVVQDGQLFRHTNVSRLRMRTSNVPRSNATSSTINRSTAQAATSLSRAGSSSSKV